MSLPRLLAPKRHPDARGWFVETYNEARLSALGIDCHFVQDNQSYSKRAGTLRGLHFQVPRRVPKRWMLRTALPGRPLVIMVFDPQTELQAGFALTEKAAREMAAGLTKQAAALAAPMAAAQKTIDLQGS
jgi:dTDP-4-dehydrorhamnose 3,5-epimerase